MDRVTRIHDGDMIRITADEADADMAIILRDVAMDVSWHFGPRSVTAHVDWCRKPFATYIVDWKRT